MITKRQTRHNSVKKKYLAHIVAKSCIKNTPIGTINLFFSNRGIMLISYGNYSMISELKTLVNTSRIYDKRKINNNIRKIRRKIINYLSGIYVNFEHLPLYLIGTQFQLNVWNEIKRIPLGETVSYQEIAIRIGKPKSYRAVGKACNDNPIPIIIPCHRVINSDKSLGGYYYNVYIKQWLLIHESLNFYKVY